MAEPTKTTKTIIEAATGNMVQESWEPLCSVEVGETAKGELTVKSVKVYAATAEEAGRQAMEEYPPAQELDGGVGGITGAGAATGSGSGAILTGRGRPTIPAA